MFRSALLVLLTIALAPAGLGFAEDAAQADAAEQNSPARDQSARTAG